MILKGINIYQVHLTLQIRTVNLLDRNSGLVLKVPARFITIEGGEGVGKSLFTGKLSDALSSLKVEHKTTREPGGTAIADYLRKIFHAPPEHEKLVMEAELCIICASRAQHVHHVVKPELARNSWVVCDRFSDSSRVYQGMIGGVQLDLLERINSMVTYGLQPDLTFVLDCDVATSLGRVKGRMTDSSEEASRYDKAQSEFHQKVRDGFLELARSFPDRMVIINAAQSVEQSVADAMMVIKDRFL